MLVKKRREMTGRSQTLPWWLGEERGKDDRKQNTLVTSVLFIDHADMTAHRNLRDNLKQQT